MQRPARKFQQVTTTVKTCGLNGRRRIVLALCGEWYPRAEIRIEEKRGDDWRMTGQFLAVDTDAINFLVKELGPLADLLEATKSQADDRFSQGRRR